MFKTNQIHRQETILKRLSPRTLRRLKNDALYLRQSDDDYLISLKIACRIRQKIIL